eukprot:5232547-Pyramimonas_sp.AAC.1
MCSCAQPRRRGRSRCCHRRGGRQISFQQKQSTMDHKTHKEWAERVVTSSEAIAPSSEWRRRPREEMA